MPAAHPKEFREDVVAVARRGDTTIAQVAKDFGISESCLRNWLHRADVEDGYRPGVTLAESEEVRDLRRRNRLLEQENEVLRRAAAYLSQANLRLGQSPKRPTRWSRTLPSTGSPSR
jgi:transposase-like protein